ncbi:hypothetical protein [Actinosynnema sp. ALI-1.44]|uniref:hypothetical protein n=1 Tax=Actinosynnema sp. ALI-1.44 TaxID=1933779 RepID=UPI00097C9487|nr:hypothetical protein [Actinosynnema sp. ALI-1.44]
MRELVYVSEAKLRQIMPSLPGGRGRLRDADAEVKTPLGVGSLWKDAVFPSGHSYYRLWSPPHRSTSSTSIRRSIPHND